MYGIYFTKVSKHKIKVKYRLQSEQYQKLLNFFLCRTFLNSIPHMLILTYLFIQYLFNSRHNMSFSNDFFTEYFINPIKKTPGNHPGRLVKVIPHTKQEVYVVTLQI